jgi:FkbM family methyltransferase
VKTEIVLFGCGGTGRKALAHLRTRGITPVAFADNDAGKWGTQIEGVPVLRPIWVPHFFPNAYWAATVLSLPASQEIPAQIAELGVKTLPLWACLDAATESAPEERGAYYGRLPSRAECEMAMRLVADDYSRQVAQDQFDFYHAPDYGVPTTREPMDKIYFPEFIKRREDEWFVDCGAADGDSVAQFIAWSPEYERIFAIEPDRANVEKLERRHGGNPKLSIIAGAVSNETGMRSFLSTGNYCSRLGTEGLAGAARSEVACYRLDDVQSGASFIKMDIEGEELKALRGARGQIQKNAPVLAVCGYHTPDHFWQVPQLIHDIEPNYRLFLRRYAPAPFELICYAVPEERLAA